MNRKKKLFDCEQSKCGRRNKVLKANWTNSLFEILVREIGTECCINFSRSECNGNEFMADGYCSECDGKVFVQSFNDHTLLEVKIRKGPKEHTFLRKRRVTHDRKKKFEEKLESNFPFNVRNDIMSEKPVMEHEPRDLPTQGALKSIRQKKRNEFMLDQNCATALRKMKYLPEFEGAIKEIALDPLHVIFWTDYQELWYRRYAITERTVVSIDATGGVVVSSNLLAGLGLNHIYSPHIFLYLIVAKTIHGVSVVVGQFLSADQHSVLISYILQCWRNKFNAPNEVVIDDSPGLLKSCVISFSSCVDPKQYLEKCFLVLNGQLNELPSSFIRLDVSHFVKTVKKIFKNSKEFQKVDPRVPELYLNCIGFIIQCVSFDDVKKIIKHMLILSQHAFEGTLNNGISLPTESSKSALKRLVRKHDLSFVAEIEADASENEYNFDECEPTTSWFDSIVSEIKADENTINLDVSCTDNFFHIPALKDILRKLCCRLPMWSAVMTPYFKSPNITSSSSNVESNFNICKNVMMKDVRLPIRIDNFLRIFLKSINGSTKIAIANYPNNDGIAEEYNKVKLSIVH